MKREIAEKLVQELSVLIEIKLHDNYKGGGFGNQTTGVVVFSYDQFLKGVGKYLATCEIDELFEIRMIGEVLEDHKWDGLGTQVIVY